MAARTAQYIYSKLSYWMRGVQAQLVLSVLHAGVHIVIILYEYTFGWKERKKEKCR